MKTGAAAFAGVFLFTLLMITREGMETALLMGTLVFQMKASDMVMGAIAGVVVAAFVASLWSRYGHRVNLGLFFQVTAVFLLIFVVQLFIYGFHELDRSQHLSLQRAASRSHRALRPRWHLRPLPDISAGADADGVARVCVALHRAKP